MRHKKKKFGYLLIRHILKQTKKEPIHNLLFTKIIYNCSRH